MNSRSPVARAEPAGDLLALGVRQRARRRGAPAPALLDERPHEAARAVALDVLGQPVEVLARELARARVETAHDAAAAEDAGEDAELGLRHRVAEVGDLEPEAHVGPVGAVAAHRLVVGHPRPRRRGELEAGRLVDAREHPLDRLDDVVFLDEAHLEVELGELGLAVGAQVLVAEAAGDLVVALVAGDHQQLLEQLRRLRQRVEVARAQARGDEEVARALGRRAGHDRRLDLEEVVRVEVVADRAVDRVADRHRALHAGPAEVDDAMAQAQQLVDRRLLVDGERRRDGLRERLGLRDLELDLAGVQARVDVALLAAHDRAGGR